MLARLTFQARIIKYIDSFQVSFYIETSEFPILAQESSQSVE